MRIVWIRVAGLTSILLFMMVFTMLIMIYGFPAFKHESPPAELIEVGAAEVGPEVSRFLWTYRLIDLIAQALLLFGVAACCAAILRVEEKK